MAGFLILAGFGFLILAGLAYGDSPSERWVHPLTQPLEIDRNGPFIELEDGSLATIDEQGFRISKDDGK
ncbi:MAG: hypothetical protein NZ781_13175, partial [Armatimonadetes bacterium]|nr:hypothetical protein [Armatimonadota bacterium]